VYHIAELCFVGLEQKVSEKKVLEHDWNTKENACLLLIVDTKNGFFSLFERTSSDLLLLLQLIGSVFSVFGRIDSGD